MNITSKASMSTVKDASVAHTSQRIGPMHRLPDLLEELGVDARSLLARCGLTTEQLRCPDSFLPSQTLVSLMEKCACATGLDDFGIRLGLLGSVSDFGMLGQFMRHAPTLRQAIDDLAGNHFRHARGSAIYVVADRDEETLGYLLMAGEAGSRQFSMLVLAYGYRLLFDLTGVEPERILFACEPPTAAQHFRHSKVEFRSLQYALVYRQQELDAPVQGANPARRQAIAVALARSGVPEPKHIVDTTRRVVVQLLVEQRLSACEVAARMGIHRRTLNRRLTPYGTSVHALIDEVRHAVALQLMSSTTLTLTEIAEFLGYNELSSFTRWMRRLDGVPPSELRHTAAE